MSSARLPRQIAIDGPAASGKTTIGRMLARRYGYLFLDTGLMYRAFTLAAVRSGISPGDHAACLALAERLDLEVVAGDDTRILIGGTDVTDLLRDPEVESAVSGYSAIREVREVMVRRQREIAQRAPAVLAGRDIGTVVLPDAPVKIYLDASEGARAERRARQTGAWPVQRGIASAQEDIASRDRIDSGREVSPLRPAPDAVLVDTTALTLDEVLERVIREVECARG